MFDMLTLDELYQLHTKLCHAHTAIHERLFGPGEIGALPRKPLVPVFSDTWNILEAHEIELGETAKAVYAEIGRRQQEQASYA